MQHDVEEKISPAFQPFLAEGDPQDRRDAIVVFRTPQPEGLPVRGRIRALKQRLDLIKAQARRRRRCRRSSPRNIRNRLP